MTTTILCTFITDDYDEIALAIQNQSFLVKIKQMKSNSIMGAFDFLKQIMSLLACLCDLDNKFVEKSTLLNLKQVCRGLIKIMIQPLIADLKQSQSIQATQEVETKAQILTKWWLTYLTPHPCLLSEAKETTMGFIKG